MKEAHFYKISLEIVGLSLKIKKKKSFLTCVLLTTLSRSVGLFLSECAASVQQGPSVNIFHVFNGNWEETQGGK